MSEVTKATKDTMLMQLKNPFDPKFIKWRVGATNREKDKGIALAYVDSREVMKRFDEVCDLDGWQSRLISTEGGFICEIDIWIGDRWVTRANAAGNTKVEPIKGGASDAFKRAASSWGVGRYLYYLPNIWVPIKAQGNSYVLAEIPELPEWAKPGAVSNWQDVAELEADASSGADVSDVVDIVIANLDEIRAVQTEDELDKLVQQMAKDDALMLANEINAKRRELIHERTINANNS